MSRYIHANWPAPQSIHALTTTIQQGFSTPPYAFNNVALHVDDNPEHVLLNRQALRRDLALPEEPFWLNQTHSTDVVVVEEEDNRNVDAAITRQENTPLVILTADCLPILLCNTEGSEIAAIHAGWRGLLHGIVQHTLQKMHSKPDALMAWIGPAICQTCYEVGDEVRAQFTAQYPFTSKAFQGRYANLPQMAEMLLRELGIHSVYQSGVCTFEEKKRCYSYRRAAQTGRMGTLIWFNSPKERTS
jgi:YfiH family protein